MKMVLVLAVVMGSAAHAGEIAERLAAPVTFGVMSRKAPDDLELCVGDALTPLGVVSALRNGTERVIFASAGGKVFATVTISSIIGGASLEGRILGRGWDDRISRSINACA